MDTENKSAPLAINAKTDFKFSQTVFLKKSFLDSQKIPYEMEELEDHSSLGMVLRYKNEDGSLTTSEQRKERIKKDGLLAR